MKKRSLGGGDLRVVRKTMINRFVSLLRKMTGKP